MEANKILQSDMLDLLFEDRNKDYGAYELRRTYNKRISLALLITASLAVAIVGATFLSEALASDADDTVEVRDVVVENIQADEPPPPPPPPPPPQAPPPPPQLETAKFTPPVIKKDEEVRKEEIPPIEKLEQVVVADKSQEGVRDEGLLSAPPVVDKGTGVVEVKPVEDENKIFEKVEIEASVNINTWRRHLESQLQRYIEDAASSGMNPGTYTVNVRFLVERDGSITDVRSLNDPGYGLGQGAVEVVKRGPKWNPGEQNGRKVRSYHTQPITFVIQDM
jgi:protein TonB